MIGRAPRKVVERILVEGTLELITPAHFGNGDIVGVTDMPLLRDPLDGQPLLTGASIAGALRNFLREWESGYGAKSGPLTDSLFGTIEKRKSFQSWLLVDDALGESPGTELRDGVSIDPATRTADYGKKYDVELLQAGTTFPLAFELLLTEDNKILVGGLAVALRGLEQGEIGMGQRKRRGFGQCKAGNWRVRRYQLTTREGLLAWLADDRATEKMQTQEGSRDILSLLEAPVMLDDHRRYISIELTCALVTSLLIRSGSGSADSPDMVHLASPRHGALRPIVSGTSLAGALRARALRIAKTIWPGARDQADDLVNHMFGRRISGRDDKPSGSRVMTFESELHGVHDLVQSRVKIDRFTGGAYPTALFTQQPVFGGDGATVTLRLALRQPKDAEIGLLLLVLKDLWTRDLPLGGETSVGRGRLRGEEAILTLHDHDKSTTWRITQTNNRLAFEGDKVSEQLERYVAELHRLQVA